MLRMSLWPTSNDSTYYTIIILYPHISIYDSVYIHVLLPIHVLYVCVHVFRGSGCRGCLVMHLTAVMCHLCCCHQRM